MKHTVVVDMGDLLQHATTLGYDWNNACALLDRVRPQYEITQRDIYVGMGEDYGLNADASRIIDDFLISHNIRTATLVDD